MKSNDHLSILSNLLSIKTSEIIIDEFIIDAVERTLHDLDSGICRVVEKINDVWRVNQEVKLAISLAFRIKKSTLMNSIDNFHGLAFDKFPSKFSNWSEDDFIKKKIRILPNSFIRYSAFIDENAVIMPSFINVGAFVGKNTMIDTWSTVGSCAYVGNSVHISGGVGIGGVLEPIQASPTIIEDNCFIGARSEICEGVIVGEGSVVAMGCYIGQSTKIINRETGEVFHGKIPSYSVVVPGSYNYQQNNNLSGYCVIIIKQVDKRTREKTSINDLLREF